MNFNFVTDRMAVGTTPDVAGIARLLDVGVTHLINCRDDHDDAATLAGSEIEYLWDGTKDWDLEAGLGNEPKPPEWFEQGLLFWLPRLAEERARLYVHCSAGANRSATMAWCLLRATGIDALDCDMIIDRHRLIAIFGTFADHPWRQDAEGALKQFGYLR